MEKFDKGPSVDGKGMDAPKPTTPGESVQGEAAGSTPGGESKTGSWIETYGPHGYKK